MRLIDADRIVYSWTIDADGEEHDGVTLQSIINKMPTIEPEDRCSECDAWNKYKNYSQPERKKGKWIDKGWNGDWQYQMDGRGNSWHEWQCSECNHITKGAKGHFCPKCGADMTQGEGNERD